MQFKDYYKILGVEPGADAKAIKSAYRRLARKYHPDVSKEAGAEDRFKEVNEAYEVLGDDKRRSEYERLRAGGFRSGDEFTPPPGWSGGVDFDFAEQGGGDFSDFFESMFGRGRAGRGRQPPRPRRGADVRATLEVDLETVAAGGKQRFQIGGSSGPRTLEVSIPVGIGNGQSIRLSKQGEPGPAGPGDLLLEIRYRAHPRFEVDGSDLKQRLEITPWDAALGGQLAVPTLQGSVTLSIPAGSRSGRRLRLKGKGLPGKTPGDLYVELLIQTPPVRDDDDRQWYEQMRERFASRENAQQ